MLDSLNVPISAPIAPAMLRDGGRRAADVPLAEHGDALGRHSFMDLGILSREV